MAAPDYLSNPNPNPNPNRHWPLLTISLTTTLTLSLIAIGRSLIISVAALSLATALSRNRRIGQDKGRSMGRQGREGTVEARLELLLQERQRRLVHLPSMQYTLYKYTSTTARPPADETAREDLASGLCAALREETREARDAQV